MVTICGMQASSSAAAASRDAHLTLRRVERQQYLITILCRQGRRRTFQELAHELGVTPRTVARDIQRLRHSGVPPISVTPGRAGGGAVLAAATEPLPPLRLDVAEIAALISSLAAVGPTVSEPARSAMKMLVDALSPPPDTRGPSGGSSNAPPD